MIQNPQSTTLPPGSEKVLPLLLTLGVQQKVWLLPSFLSRKACKPEKQRRINLSYLSNIHDQKYSLDVQSANCNYVFLNPKQHMLHVSTKSKTAHTLHVSTKSYSLPIKILVSLLIHTWLTIQSERTFPAEVSIKKVDGRKLHL